MWQFSRLRIAGFKSFVDPTDLAILPGLTGIVGPNGCGKSNLVEALRWLMGEASARQVRGDEMEDVIFAGSATRPPRNLAEVVVELERAVADDAASAEAPSRRTVSRSIERGKGSAYRIDGREARARDVQLLFADAATGPRSTALISQGQVSALITAKPRDRRLILEEAAGLSGLQARRHEAELRLSATETNIQRAEDVLAALSTQLQHLRRQARQATRYRTLGEAIRATEAALLCRRWLATVAAAERATADFSAADAAVAAARQGLDEALQRQAGAAAPLASLRAEVAAAAADVQRLRVTAETCAGEEARITADLGACRRRLEQARADLGREHLRAADADAAHAQLMAEDEQLRLADDADRGARDDKVAAVSAAAAEVARLDNEVTTATAALAAADADRAARERRQRELESRLAALDERHRTLIGERRALDSALAAAGDEDADRPVSEAAAALARARAALEDGERRAALARDAATAAATAAAAAAADHARARAEADALAALLGAARSDDAPPLIDAVVAPAGLEAAMAAAFGEDLLLPESTASASGWRALPPLDDQPLPAGVTPLTTMVEAPPALARRLSRTGLVADDADGERLHPALRPGQQLVGRDGTLWRWDGLYRAADESATAARLRHRRRLEAVMGTLPRLDADRAAAAAALSTATAAVDAATTAERSARAAVKAAEDALDRARDAQVAIRRRAATLQGQRLRLEGSEASTVSEIDATRRELDAVTAEAARHPHSGAAAAALAAARQALVRARAQHADVQGALDGMAREAESRRHRRGRIAAEAATWQTRGEAARAQIAVLEARVGETEVELARLEVLPEALARRRAALAAETAAAALRCEDAERRLAAAEDAGEQAVRAVRAAEAAVATTREERARAGAALDEARRNREALSLRLCDQLGADAVDSAETLAAGAEGDDATLDRRLERLTRERDQLGPVNLRADQESADLEEQVQTLERERSDLQQAVAKLRRGIAELDREGRERLLARFRDVDRHFGDLFRRLFGGGEARLALSEGDDPLTAGLDIVACPPGKRPQSLSLLSGGEQALATLALVFAVFRTQPSPLCVLDEVDAALDDANVDRFCALLADLAPETGTRFLTVTHHRLTMASMDRLYGVTMAERGVSQLVSVDLRRAEELRQTA